MSSTPDVTPAQIAARIERLPFSRWHVKLRVVMGVATFFDAGSAWNKERDYKAFVRNSQGELVTRDLLMGMGTGARIYFLAFLVRFDVAWAWNWKGFSMKQARCWLLLVAALSALMLLPRGPVSSWVSSSPTSWRGAPGWGASSRSFLGGASPLSGTSCPASGPTASSGSARPGRSGTIRCGPKPIGWAAMSSPSSG